MSSPGPAPDHNLEFRTYIDEAATLLKELRQVIDRIVELRPHEKSTQNLDQIVDVLEAKLSAAAIRAARSSPKPISGKRRSADLV
jgi:hypothetical protein